MKRFGIVMLILTLAAAACSKNTTPEKTSLTGTWNFAGFAQCGFAGCPYTPASGETYQVVFATNRTYRYQTATKSTTGEYNTSQADQETLINFSGDALYAGIYSYYITHDTLIIGTRQVNPRSDYYVKKR